MTQISKNKRNPHTKPLDPLDPLAPIVDPLDPTPPVGPVDPVDPPPVDPVDPVDPADPDSDPDEKSKSSFKDVTRTGKIASPVTPEMIRMNEFDVAFLGEVGPAFIMTPDGAIMFKTNMLCESFISRGAVLIIDDAPSADVISKVLILSSSLQSDNT